MFLVNTRGDEQMIAIKLHKRRVKVGMSVVAEIILDIINRNTQMGMYVPIMALIDRTVALGLASQATNHRALDWLRKNKYIKTEFKNGNVRTKYLVSTKKGLTHFKGLD